MDPFEFIPDEIILETAYYEPINYITSMCQSSRRFNNVICNSNIFWKQKFIHDFGKPPRNIINWKEAYQNYGEIFSFGDNGSGKLGLHRYYSQNTPALIPNLRAKFVACGGDHSMIIDLNDNVWGFGFAEHGQLGIGPMKHPFSRPDPTPLNIKSKFISCGAFHTILIDLDDNVWSCGVNRDGQLGVGDNQNKYDPTPIFLNGENLKAKYASCGHGHTILIDLNNNVWSFGNGQLGQLGLGDDQSKNIPTPLMINGQGIKAKSVSCGFYCTMIIDLNSNIWVFGDNQYEMLGVQNIDLIYSPIQIENLQAKSVSCGRDHTMIIDLNNNVLSCGSNWNGQLGLGDNVNRNIPTPLIIDGQMIQAKIVSCGAKHSMIIDMDDNLWAFGNNKNGRLGLGDNEDRNIPTSLYLKAQSVSCGYKHNLIIGTTYDEFGDGVRLIPYNELIRYMDEGYYIEVLPEDQNIPHKEGNSIGSFYGNDDIVYLSEIQYDQINDIIMPPI